MSHYTKKLWFSGIEENWELADIYNHEVEEIAENIVEGNYTDDDINISELMGVMLLPAIEKLEESIDSQDRERFERRYNTLIQTCNSCHNAANYGAVQIMVPEINPFNQDFKAR